MLVILIEHECLLMKKYSRLLLGKKFANLFVVKMKKRDFYSKTFLKILTFSYNLEKICYSRILKM